MNHGISAQASGGRPGRLFGSLVLGVLALTLLPALPGGAQGSSAPGAGSGRGTGEGAHPAATPPAASQPAAGASKPPPAAAGVAGALAGGGSAAPPIPPVPLPTVSGINPSTIRLGQAISFVEALDNTPQTTSDAMKAAGPVVRVTGTNLYVGPNDAAARANVTLTIDGVPATVTSVARDGGSFVARVMPQWQAGAVERDLKPGLRDVAVLVSGAPAAPDPALSGSPLEVKVEREVTPGLTTSIALGAALVLGAGVFLFVYLPCRSIIRTSQEGDRAVLAATAAAARASRSDTLAQQARAEAARVAADSNATAEAKQKAQKASEAAAANLQRAAREKAEADAKVAGYTRTHTTSLLKLLLLDPETNTYSLSRAQFLWWLHVIALAYLFLFLGHAFVQDTWDLPVLSGAAYTFLVSLGTLVAAQVTTAIKGSKGSGEENPSAADLFVNGGVLALDRVQQALWSLIAGGMFLGSTIATYSTSTGLPNIPQELIVLMGLSSAGYIGGKLARKPGPKIDQVVPGEVVDGTPTIKIAGIDLSMGGVRDEDKNTIHSRVDIGARVYLDSATAPQPFDQVFTLEEEENHPGEFCKLLQVSLAGQPDGWLGNKHTISVMNADGQRAVWSGVVGGPPPSGPPPGDVSGGGAKLPDARVDGAGGGG